jgi:hypothetical protein
MQIPELIASQLDLIRRSFYADRQREFKRDERALTKAIARYGYECAQRGWTFQVDFIANELRQLLISIRTAEADFKYLPTYLEGAIRRHIGQRAEEHQKQSGRVAIKVEKILDGIQPVVVVQPTNEELLGKLYVDLKKTMRRRRAERVAQKKQIDLL